MNQRSSVWIVVGVVVAGLPLLLLLTLVLLSPSDGTTATSSMGGKTTGVPEQYQRAVETAGAVCSEISGPLIAAQINAESGWNPTAQSGVGAEGISQFMPATWASVGRDGDGDSKADVWNATDAIVTQGYYMCQLAAQVKADIATGKVRGDVSALTLAAYNAGLGSVEAAGGIPAFPETSNYVTTILAAAGGYTAGGGTAVTGDVGGAISWAEGIAADNTNAYVWGGNGRQDGGYDCSGLTQAFMARLGVTLPRTAAEQQQEGHQITAEQAQPGDLIFYGDPAYHVAIYIGNGRMVSADNEQDGINTEAVYGSPSGYRRYR
ncbi:NlpC/P60 family protein [Propionibacterium freudenreichii]|uniref:C40 family peptidase n=2 Tax=Propionibacterium TaxID=1743 RepID=UPI0005A5C8A4|nr:bifunctional lytic transglycosylase/C40 family peptidase [Propionibacterium freudenreichii]CEI30280.1 cell wall hydrolase [Propionibacterium freudenreichii]